MKEPTWVSWRWLFGLGGALLVSVLWLFERAGPVWLSVPVLLVLALPRLRWEPGVRVVLTVLLLQNVPALALLVFAVREALGTGELDPLTSSLIAGFIMLAGIVHGLWVARSRGPVGGLGAVLGATCAALAVSGWLLPIYDADIVTTVLLMLGGDVVSSVSPELRPDTAFFPTVIFSLFLVVYAGLPLVDGEFVPQTSAVVIVALVSLPVVWSAKRSERRQRRSHRRATG